jgi:hypothetical protein
MAIRTTERMAHFKELIGTTELLETVSDSKRDGRSPWPVKLVGFSGFKDVVAFGAAYSLTRKLGIAEMPHFSHSERFPYSLAFYLSAAMSQFMFPTEI